MTELGAAARRRGHRPAARALHRQRGDDRARRGGRASRPARRDGLARRGRRGRSPFGVALVPADGRAAGGARRARRRRAPAAASAGASISCATRPWRAASSTRRSFSRTRRCSRSARGSARSPTSSPTRAGAPLSDRDRPRSRRPARRALRRAIRTCGCSSATCSSCRSTHAGRRADGHGGGEPAVQHLDVRSSSACSTLRARVPARRLMLQREVARSPGGAAGADALRRRCRCWCRRVRRCASRSGCRAELPPAAARRFGGGRRALERRRRASTSTTSASVRGGRARRLRPAAEDAAQRARRARGRAAIDAPRSRQRSRAPASIRAARAETLDLDDFARLRAPRSPGERMPELPEVETIVRGLAPELRARRDRGRDGPRARGCVAAWRPTSRAGLTGRRIAGVAPARQVSARRRSTTGGIWLVHLGMTGRLTLVRAAPARMPHDHVVVAPRRRPCRSPTTTRAASVGWR